ncbi:MAG: hypothetical protein KY460_03705, partial [Actinobacteria bacterium]|nr:hypothetical protein [Actinomycetota bacterium]
DADPGEPSAPIVADDAPAAHEPGEDTETGTGGTDRPAAEVPVTDAATPVTPAPDDVSGEPAGSDDDSIAAPAPQRGSPDDLRLISGVGPALERLLHERGITTFRNLALLDDAAIEDLRSRSPRLVTRLRRDAWVSQARRLHIETHGDEP